MTTRRPPETADASRRSLGQTRLKRARSSGRLVAPAAVEAVAPAPVAIPVAVIAVAVVAIEPVVFAVPAAVVAVIAAETVVVAVEPAVVAPGIAARVAQVRGEDAVDRPAMTSVE